MEDHFPARLIILLLSTLLSGCEKPTERGSTSILDLLDPDLITTTRVQFEKISDNQARRAVIAADALQLSVQHFLATPTAVQQTQVKDRWISAHNAFLAAAFFSFEDQSQKIYQIDAWPIQPGFLDSLPGYPHSGIVNDMALTISETSLRVQHGITDEREVSLGFHALEFLTFRRTIDDFADAEDETRTRRRRTLKIVAKLLNQDISAMFVERQQSNQSFRTNTMDTSLVLALLLKRLHEKTQTLFSEANQITNGNSGHSELSLTSWGNLSTQVEILVELTSPQTAMARLFTLMDKKTAVAYRTTLKQTREILAEDNPDEEALARLTLLLAALGHQLGDFRVVLQNTGLQNTGLQNSALQNTALKNEPRG